MKPSEALEGLRTVGLASDERVATFLMLGEAAARGDGAGVRQVARFRLVRMRGMGKNDRLR